jgi:hypothetical protein
MHKSGENRVKNKKKRNMKNYCLQMANVWYTHSVRRKTPDNQDKNTAIRRKIRKVDPMKKFFATMLLLSMLLTALVPATALGSAPVSGRLMLYSSLPVTQLDLMVAMFNEKYPDITVDVFSADSADVFARAQAEAGVAGGLVLGAAWNPSEPRRICSPPIRRPTRKPFMTGMR